MKQISDSWVQNKAAQAFLTAAEASGYEAYFVGGCVRNALLGLPVNDLDIATNARPDAVIKLAKELDFKAIPTGIEHGTVTLVGAGSTLEITTYRNDVETDGRRAVVAFSDQVEDDAARRDFRINALYADRHGMVLDPTGGGIADIKARRLQFVGKAAQRIREDYLRIIRLFRFAAQLGFGADGMDAAAVEAAGQHADGLAKVSIERKTAELMKLLASPDPADVLQCMSDKGVLARLLPKARLEPLLNYIRQEGGTASLGRLAAATHDSEIALMRLSKRDANVVSKAKALLNADHSLEAFAYRNGVELSDLAVRVKAAVQGASLDAATFEKARFAAEQVFPISAKDLMPQVKGKALGDCLHRLEERWIASGFQLTKEALLALASDKE